MLMSPVISDWPPGGSHVGWLGSGAPYVEQRGGQRADRPDKTFRAAERGRKPTWHEGCLHSGCVITTLKPGGIQNQRGLRYLFVGSGSVGQNVCSGSVYTQSVDVQHVQTDAGCPEAFYNGPPPDTRHDGKRTACHTSEAV